MLDALVALSLAGNIVQFIDFGIKTTKTVRELYKSVDGKLPKLSEMEEEAINQIELFKPILRGRMKQIDSKLLKSAATCSSISNELVDLLKSLQLDPQKNRLIEAASKSIKSHLAKSRIKDMEGRLLKVRDEVCTRLLFLLSQQQDELASRFTALARLTESTSVETRIALEAAVVKLLQEIQTKSWEIGDKDTFTSFAKDLKTFITHTQNSERILRVLNSLHFKQFKERQSEIRQEHKHTFEWIYGLQSKSNFSTWLKSEQGIYWIEGKPGSGKSTLMKFLIRNQKTMRLLQQWAGTKGLVVVSHFFWSAGTKLQKSQNGLFRSLLFQIFSHCPEIIPDVAPDRWGSELYPGSMGGWDWAELFSTFEKIASLDNLSSKLCLFIDGLDEYDGDHVELIEILKTAAKSSSIKICASSRPWYDFIDAFGHQKWKLCVQDLTANDILLYVRENLEQDLRFKRLKQKDELATAGLVQEIRTKSCGVFLWVYLVVRSLLRGLRNSDRIPDLRRRLYELPCELEKYFELMLDSIEKVYQQTTARIFKIMIAAQGTLPILAFHFLDQEEYENDHARKNFVSIPLDQFDTLINEKKRQLHANCRDLLWVTPQDPDAEVLLRDRVGFLHRTVMDFLQTKHMDTVLSARAGDGFRAARSLSMIHLALLKTHTEIKTNRVETTYSLALSIIFYAHQAEISEGIAETLVLDELESLSNILSFNWQDISGANDCDNFFDYIVRAGLQHYTLEKIKVMSLNDASVASEALRNALRARFTIEQDVYFASRMETGVDISMIQFLLDIGVNPNSKLSGSDKSVWYDFLITLESQFPRKERDPAWDMTTYLDPSRPPYQYPEEDDSENVEAQDGSNKPEALWLPNWFEACEILISRGAKNRMYTIHVGQSFRGPTYSHSFASDSIQEVFTPEQARILLQRYKSMKPPPSIWCRIFPFNQD